MIADLCSSGVKQAPFLKILVCFKVLPDFDQILDAEWPDITPASDFSYAKKIFNCFDESALEIALRLRDSLKEAGGEVSCTALTMGNPPPNSFVRTLFAVGFDHVRLQKDADTEFQPGKVAKRIAEYAAWEGYDLVLAGKYAGMADTGAVPLLMAEYLGFPCVTEAETVALYGGEERAVSITHVTDLGIEEIHVLLPVVVVIGNSSAAAMRSATLREQMAAGKRGIEILPEDGITPSSGELKTTEPVLIHRAVEKKCRFLEEKDVRIAARKIYDEFLRGGGVR